MGVDEKELSGIHCAFLFHPEGWEALKSMCTLLSGTLPSPFISSWKDLAARLQLTIHQIGCIENGRLDDCTRLVLKSFAQRDDATLERVVNALDDMKRSDVISNAWPHLLGLKEFVLESKQEEVERLREELVEEVKASLPLTLSLGGRKGVCRRVVAVKATPPAPAPHAPAPPTPKRKCSLKVLLTFGADGEGAAREVAAIFRRSRAHIAPIGVLILEDHYEKVVANPQRFILKYLRQVDYVIPILSEGYLRSIEEKKGGGGGEWSGEGGCCCLDAQYAQFIYTLILHHYVKSGCLNRKVRCLIAEGHLTHVSSHPLIETSPVLGVALAQAETERLARQLLMAKLKTDRIPPPTLDQQTSLPLNIS